MRPLFPLALVLLLPVVGARADDAVQIELVAKALAGEGQPGLVVKAQAPLSKVRLEVVRSVDKKKVVQEVQGVAGGRSHTFPLVLAAPGRARFEGRLMIALDDGQTGEMPIAVDVELVGPLVLAVAPGDVHLAERTLTLSANRAMARVELSLTSDHGAPMGVHEAKADGPTVTLSWPASPAREKLLRIHLRAWDADGFFGAIELFPWQVDIPHEEVHFTSGSHEIPAGEASKLDGSYAEIAKAIDTYGKLATIRLFIGGHTDTVGDAASNRALSERRAAAIGRWFKKRGVGIPILTAGFGEDVLLVTTADETDEARNRRAEYIVAVDAPSIRGRTPWVALR